VAESRSSPAPTLQAKLTIGAPNDPYEQEADRVAAQVVQTINAPQTSPTNQSVQRETAPEEEDVQMKPLLQRDAAPEEEEDVQMKSLLQRDTALEAEEAVQLKRTQEPIGGGDASADLESAINRARGQGQPLEPILQKQMGQAMGADFSGVNIHTDTQSDQLNRSIQAKAFTTGQDIFFRQGAYQPSSRAGQELVAHELTHVIQQSHAKVARKPTGPRRVMRRHHTAQTIAHELMGQPAPALRSRTTPSIQRDLMSEKAFKQVTYGGKFRKRGPALEALETAIKGYHAQPDVGKSTYLGRLINQADAYIDKKRGEGLKETHPRIAGTRKLISSARDEMEALAISGARQQDVNQPAPSTVRDPAPSRKYESVDGQQYRITGRAPNRVIEEVKRYQDDQGTVRYVAVGEVVDFRNHLPVVNIYTEPVDLGDWYPQITQLNGMNVKPTTGIRDAVSLQTQVNQTIDEALGDRGLTIGQDTVDVLYTYSAKLGKKDIIDCIKGKLGITDEVTQLQKQVMLDAVAHKQRVIVSAHSRGTIKTDNAVRMAHKELFASYKTAFSTVRRQAAIERCKEYYQSLPEDIKAGISEDDAIAYFLPAGAATLAEETVLKDMDEYIKLIYAGNAVQYPSSKIKIKMFVGKKDVIVSGLVGTYTDWGSRFGSGNQETSLKKVKGGHSFSNYFKHVGEEAAKDMLAPLGM
jgi:hypothetical protein